MANTLLKSATLAAILLASALPTFGQNLLTINTDKGEEDKKIRAACPGYSSYMNVPKPISYPTSVIQGKATNYTEALMLIDLGKEKLDKAMTPGNSTSTYYSLVTESRAYIDNGLRFLKYDILEAIRTGKPKTPGVTLLHLQTGYERLEASTQAEKDFCDSMEKRIAYEQMNEDSKNKVYEKSIQNIYERLKKDCGNRSKELSAELKEQNETWKKLEKHQHQQRLRDEIAGRTKF